MDPVNLTAAALLRFAPNAHADIVAALVAGNSKLQVAAIATPLRLAHFMAEIATETGGFTIYEENLNYSASRLTQVWPSHFPTIAAAAPYAHNPQELANFIYADANRSAPYKLGNTEAGDGWRYRGRGLIQTTGREGYRAVGYEDNPDALNDPAIGLDAAIAEFVRSGCLALADVDDVVAVRRRINGGEEGLDRCRVWLADAKALWGASASGVAPSAGAETNPRVISAQPWDLPGWEKHVKAGGTRQTAWTQASVNLALPSLPALDCDGIYGPKTANAVAFYRMAKGLGGSGIDTRLVEALTPYAAAP